MNPILQPWQLLALFLASWINRKPEMIEYLRIGIAAFEVLQEFTKSGLRQLFEQNPQSPPTGSTRAW